MEEFVFHHVGIAVGKLSEAIPAYKNLLNYQVISGPFDDPVQRVSVCFLSRGQEDTLIELVAPLGPESPIDQTLRRGGSIYHICYQVLNMSDAISHLTVRGAFLLSDPVPAVAFEMREIAWVMAEGNLLIELLQA